MLGAALVMIAALAGQGVAGLLTGTGWVWPDSRQLMPSVGAVLSGHPRVAPAWLVYLLVAAVVGLALVWYGWALRWVWTELGPGRRAGWPPARRPPRSLWALCIGCVTSSVRTCTGDPTRAGAVVAARVDDGLGGRTHHMIRLGSRFGVGGGGVR